MLSYKSGSVNKPKQGNKYFVSLLILMLLAFIFLPVVQSLVLSEYKTGKTLIALPMEDGEVFKIRYTHSVNLSPVIDAIEWTGKELMVLYSEFKTFGAGIPIPSDGAGELVVTDEGYRLIDINKPQESFLLMIEEIPDHRLLYRQNEISLIELCGGAKAIKFEVRRVSPLIYIFYGYSKY